MTLALKDRENLHMGRVHEGLWGRRNTCKSRVKRLQRVGVGTVHRIPREKGSHSWKVRPRSPKDSSCQGLGSVAHSQSEPCLGNAYAIKVRQVTWYFPISQHIFLK